MQYIKKVQKYITMVPVRQLLINLPLIPLYTQKIKRSVWHRMIVIEQVMDFGVGRLLVVLRITQQQHLVWLQQARQSAKAQLVRHIVQYTEGHGIFIQRQVRQLDTHTTCTMSLQVLVIVKVTAQRGVDIHLRAGQPVVRGQVLLVVVWH